MLWSTAWPVIALVFILQRLGMQSQTSLLNEDRQGAISKEHRQIEAILGLIKVGFIKVGSTFEVYNF